MVHDNVTLRSFLSLDPKWLRCPKSVKPRETHHPQCESTALSTDPHQCLVTLDHYSTWTDQDFGFDKGKTPCKLSIFLRDQYVPLVLTIIGDRNTFEYQVSSMSTAVVFTWHSMITRDLPLFSRRPSNPRGKVWPVRNWTSDSTTAHSLVVQRIRPSSNRWRLLVLPRPQNLESTQLSLHPRVYIVSLSYSPGLHDSLVRRRTTGTPPTPSRPR